MGTYKLQVTVSILCVKNGKKYPTFASVQVCISVSMYSYPTVCTRPTHASLSSFLVVLAVTVSAGLGHH